MKNHQKSVSSQSVALGSPYDKCSFYVPFYVPKKITTSLRLLDQQTDLNETQNKSSEQIELESFIINSENVKQEAKPTGPAKLDDIDRLDAATTSSTITELNKKISYKRSMTIYSGRSQAGEINSIKSRVPIHVRKSFSEVKSTNLDHVLGLTGSFGFYQKFKFLLVGFLAIIPSMVAYSYVFVSATPRFTCSVVREIQLISTNSSIKLDIDEYGEADADDPFGHLNWEMHEYIIETRRFIRLISETMPKENVIVFIQIYFRIVSGVVLAYFNMGPI
jgi:hypothetical protein